MKKKEVYLFKKDKSFHPQFETHANTEKNKILVANQELIKLETHALEFDMIKK